MNKRLRAALAGSCIGAAAMGGAASAKPTTQPVNIPVIMPLTGFGAFLGTGEKESLQLVEKTVNANGGVKGAPLRFTYYDDQSSPQVSVQLARRVMGSKPSVILGSSLVALCRAMVPLMKTGPVEYCFSPGLHPARGDYSFTASVSTGDLARLSMRYLRTKGWSRIALIVSTDATGQDFENGIKRVMARPSNKKLKFVDVEHFNTSDVSVSAQIEKIKKSNPQVLIAWSTGGPIQTVFRGMLEDGLNVPLVTTDGNMTYAQMKQYAAFLPKQLYMPSGEYIANNPKIVQASVAKAQKAFYNAFKTIGKKPDEPSELAWDPAMIIVHALRTLGPKASAKQIHDFLVPLKGFAGIDGVYDFQKIPQRGLDVSNAVMTRWNKKTHTFQIVSKPGGAPL